MLDGENLKKCPIFLGMITIKQETTRYVSSHFFGVKSPVSCSISTNIISHASRNQYIYIYMSYGRNYLFGEYAITKCGGSPIGFQGFGRSGHQHQNKSMRFTVWDDLICYMIENCRRASQDARVPFDSTCKYNYKIFECALVHLGCTYSRHL